jgi:glutamate decarboxylase
LLEPQALKLLEIGATRNQIDKTLYPQSAELEVRCVNILADLWNSPEAANATGTASTGSSEACMLGGLALKWQWRKKRQAEGKDTSKPNLIFGPVQICWWKFCQYFDVEPRQVPLRKGAATTHPEDILPLIDENTIGVVSIFGVTYTCAYEDVEAMSKVLDKYEKETGLNIPIHVDAACGGMVAPFVDDHKHLVFDFRLPRVKSINVSGHKYALAPLGIGWTVWRTKADLPEELIFYVNYLGGNMPTFALTFSRPSGQIAAQYYQFLRLGREGYKQVHEACRKTAIWLGQEIVKLGDFEIIYDGKMGLPAISYKMKAGVSYDLYELGDRLAIRGWKVASYPLPKNDQDTHIQRVLVKQGFSTDMAHIFLKDIKQAISDLKAKKK